MTRKANPVAIGAFVLGALALIIAGLVVLGGGKFFRQSQRWVLYFEGSIKGLNVGSPVTFRGVKIGSVTDIVVTVDRKNVTVRTPVFIEVEAARFREADGRPIRFEKGAPDAALLIERGLRAQLQVQSFVTGQLAIDLDFYPGTPVKLAGLTKDHPELPTIPSSLDKLAHSIENLPLDEIAKELVGTLEAIRVVVASPEFKAIVPAALKLVKDANERILTVSASLENTLKDARETIATVGARADEVLRDGQALLRNVDGRVGPLATTVQEAVTKAEANLAAALADVQTLARNVDRRVGPVVDDLEKALRGAQEAFAKAQVTLDGVNQIVEPGSPTAYNLNAALESVARAADALRHLTNYLAQHPNAVVFGRGRAEESTQ